MFVACIALALLGSQIGGIKAGIGHLVDLAVDDVGHVLGTAEDDGGIGSLEEIMDRGGEKRQPVIKAGFAHICRADQLGVCGERVSSEGASAEEHRVPKVIHLWQVRLPVHLSDVVENGAELFITADAVIKGVHEADDVGAGGEVL